MATGQQGCQSTVTPSQSITTMFFACIQDAATLPIDIIVLIGKPLCIFIRRSVLSDSRLWMMNQSDRIEAFGDTAHTRAEIRRSYCISETLSISVADRLHHRRHVNELDNGSFTLPVGTIRKPSFPSLCKLIGAASLSILPIEQLRNFGRSL